MTAEIKLIVALSVAMAPFFMWVIGEVISDYRKRNATRPVRREDASLTYSDGGFE